MDTSKVAKSLALTGTASALWVSGIQFSKSSIAGPLFNTLLEQNPPAITERAFETFYHRGVVTVFPITVLSTICCGTAAYLTPSKRIEYGVAAGLLVGSHLWTRIAMPSFNEPLMRVSQEGVITDEGQKEELEYLLRSWGVLNVVRTGMIGVAGILGLLSVSDTFQ